MQQLVANWVECVARLSSVNPSVAVLSSVCSHLTGSKSVFVCLIVRSSVGVLCTNAKSMCARARMCVYMHTCVNVTYKQMEGVAVYGPSLSTCLTPLVPTKIWSSASLYNKGLLTQHVLNCYFIGNLQYELSFHMFMKWWAQGQARTASVITPVGTMLEFLIKRLRSTWKYKTKPED